MKEKPFGQSFRRDNALRFPAARRCLTALIAVCVSLGTSSCSDTHRYHIKLSVDAIVGGVKYHGEGVQKYLCHHAYKAMNDLDQCTVLGEAIPLESSDHHYLFVLIWAANGKDPTEMASRILTANGQAPFAVRDDRLPRQWDLEPDDVPMIVRFADLRDPRSVQLMGKSFDPRIEGVKIESVSASAESTDDEVTKGRIAKILPWITDPFYSNKLVGNVDVEESKQHFLASTISREMFKTGE